jgi:hypothetical protein
MADADLPAPGPGAESRSPELHPSLPRPAPRAGGTAPALVPPEPAPRPRAARCAAGRAVGRGRRSARPRRRRAGGDLRPRALRCPRTERPGGGGTGRLAAAGLRAAPGRRGRDQRTGAAARRCRGDRRDQLFRHRRGADLGPRRAGRPRGARAALPRQPAAGAGAGRARHLVGRGARACARPLHAARRPAGRGRPRRHPVRDPFQRAAPEDIDPPACPAGREGEARAQIITVQPGNSLWRISREHYGEGVRYVQIYQANVDQIRDPDLIYPGQIFVLPD